jgi:hypothetical protein
MCPDVGRVATLRDNARVGPDGTVRVDLVLTVCLIVILALPALKAGIALGTDTNTLALLDQGHLGSDTDSLSNNLWYPTKVSRSQKGIHYEREHTVTDSKRKVLLAPTSTKCVDITSTDATAFNFDVDIVVAKWLGLELVLVEFEPCVRSVDLEALELLWIRHVGEVLCMVGEACSTGRDGDSKQHEEQ